MTNKPNRPPRPLTSIVGALTLFFAALPACAEPLSPEEAQRHFKVAEGFDVKLFACEPMVRQPVTMTFDDRGRMWLIQYLQYPAPAGLNPVEVDQYLRTKYDRVPEPPPKGPRGADRVTILEDTDGDGRADKAKDFVTGLNLASALAIGHGGVFVAQAPYLLFYPDRDGDDVPDGDPEVLLTGFGMEDAHAVVNSMQWGPDGWLYGAQGSTVTANIRGIAFQQGIWRYHPLTKKFELFAEGGGNTWGLDFDRHGNAIAGTNFGDRILLHQVQGGYYVKGFSKHGPLHNPYTYGYFEHAPHQGWRGGHVTCGGILYQGDSFGPKFRDTYIAANLLSNAVYWHAIEPDGSTFKTRFLGELLTTDDIWFRPIDCLTGPDGSVMVADWYDQRANHVIPEDTWDRSNGRIWKIEARGAKPAGPLAMSKLSSNELVDILSHPNDWYAREARRILAERRDSAVYPRLGKMIAGSDEHLSLQALWALYVSGGWDEALGCELLTHPSADVRTWAVRLLGDERQVSADTQAGLEELARREPVASVRGQLACSAKRLPGPACLAIVARLIEHDEDAADPFLPLLIWWAVEDKALTDREQVFKLVEKPGALRRPIVEKVLLERLARRWLAEATDEGYASCARLLAVADEKSNVHTLASAMEKELAGKPLRRIPAPLEKPLAVLLASDGSDLRVMRLAIRLGSAEAYGQAMKILLDRSQPESTRLSLIEVLGPLGRGECVPALLNLLNSGESEPIRLAALSALEHFSDEVIAARVLSIYPQLPPTLRARSMALLASRKAWSQALLAAVEAGQIDAKDVAVEQLRQIVLHDDEQLTSLVEKHWGKVRPATPGEKQAELVVLARTLGEGTSDAAKGRELFLKHCGTCHAMYGEGTKLGPDLTSIDRRNRNFLLLNILDPSNSIRPEYVAQTITTTDGRILSGLVTEASAQSLTVVDAKNVRTVLPRGEIDEVQPSSQSLMPERILESLQPQELRDLFGYLQSAGPLASARREIGSQD